MHRQHRDDPDGRVRRAWATIHTRGVTGTGLGAGVIVADGFLLTCAHVINAALGRDKMAPTAPTAAEMLRIAASFPCLGSEQHPVELAGWLAPKPCNGQWWDGDLALLRADLRDPALSPVPVRETPGRRLSTWYAHGAPRSLVDVYVQATMGPWYILDPGYAPLEIEPGHSGAPLWDRERGCVTGLVVSTEPDRPRSYAIRASRMVKLLHDAGVLPAAAAAPADARTRARRREMADALDALPDGKLERCAGRVGSALGLSWTPDTGGELVDAALSHPRGVPALLSALTAFEAVALRVREAAAKLGPVRLLTQDEYDDLEDLLGPDPYQEVRAAARRAVPHLSFAHAGQAGIGALVEDLEDRASEPGVVPPLIQVVEEVAASRRDGGDLLREWSQGVATRLGVSPDAMAQCRWSAKSRAAALTAQPVLRVWLWPQPDADAFHYDIRLYDHDAHEEPARTWTDGDALRDRDELCAALSDAVDDLDQYEESTGVEFLLEEGFFHLPVDRLPTRAGSLGTRPIGLDRAVVLRGQNVPRSGARKARWERGRSTVAEPYVVHELRAADGTLSKRSEIACVIACCPPDQRDGTLALCRHLGVPVVLWHRAAHGPDAAEQLRAVVHDDWPHSLREQVRQRRAEALHDSLHMGAHLALLWEDPGWSPPRRRLANPTRREGGAA
ncbi:trypsin-like peptidase domain-containing protein [Streptomyces sp. NPDC052309]|uniref:VMAP-C domain-containing protein n=1 Tax=Streptomyces sp. NPDC052309 TaxID=3155421 RepID=UPI003449C08D